MAYDDVIRVADLKTRATRFRRVETRSASGTAQILQVTEFMHPRIEEVCGTLPAPLGSYIMARPRLVRALDRVVNKGRHFRTDRFDHFVALCFIGGLRRLRRKTAAPPHRDRASRGVATRWRATRAKDYALAVEVLHCRRLIKGYSDTHERGESKYDRVISAASILVRPGRRRRLAPPPDRGGAQGREGDMLDGALKTIQTL